jgi:hypothetical protein
MTKMSRHGVIPRDKRAHKVCAHFIARLTVWGGLIE